VVTCVQLIVSTDTTEVEWDSFVERHPDASGYHLWRWRRVMERAFGHRTVYLAARRDDDVVGVLPAVMIKSRLFGRSLVSLPFLNYGGVVASDAEVARLLLDHAASVGSREGASHFELRHLVQRFTDLPVKRHKVTMRLRLCSSETDQWAHIDRKVRNHIRKAQKSNLTGETGGRELLGDFYAVFAHNMRDLGTPVYGRRVFEEVFEQFPTAARVFVVRHEGSAVAAAIGYTFRDTIEIPWASSLKAYRPLCANTLLYWHAMQHAIANGLATFDFGRSTPGDGPFQFKSQWGAEPSPLAWEYRLFKGERLPDQSPSNPKFRAAIAMWKRLPVPVATWLGPAIVRSIP
jgi:FemAB-related protein (PEP-CTERM system-associated)